MSVFERRGARPNPPTRRGIARARPRTNAPARAGLNPPRIVGMRTKIGSRDDAPTLRHVTLTTHPSVPSNLSEMPSRRSRSTSAGSLRAHRGDPRRRPRRRGARILPGEGLLLTISIPLAVKLAQARDKARRRARRASRPPSHRQARHDIHPERQGPREARQAQVVPPASARAAGSTATPATPRSITIATSSSTATRTSSSATTSACSAGPALSGTPPPSPSAPRNARRGDRPSASTALRRRPRKIARLAFARSRRPRSRRGSVPRSDSFSAAVPGNAVKSARRGRRLGCARWRRRARSARGRFSCEGKRARGNPHRGTRRTVDCTRRRLKRRISLERCSISSTPTPCRRRSASSSSRT